MAKRSKGHLTPLEGEIMHVLWEAGPSTVHTVQQQLARALAYTTVQTMLNILTRKNKVSRVLKDRALLHTECQPRPIRRPFGPRHGEAPVQRIGGTSGDESG